MAVLFYFSVSSPTKIATIIKVYQSGKLRDLSFLSQTTIFAALIYR